MPMTRADLQSALNAAMAERVKLEFGELFNGMFTGQKNHAAAIKRFRDGLLDHLEAHAEASAVINKIGQCESAS